MTTDADKERILSGHLLFRGFTGEEIGHIARMGLTEEKAYAAGETVLAFSSRSDRIGVVLEGKLLALRSGSPGSPHVIERYRAGDVIGMDGAFSALRKSPVEVRADKKSRVLLIDIDGVRTVDAFRGRITDNFLAMLSEKGIRNIQRMDILMGLTLRERIAAFLRNEERRIGNEVIESEITQTELAGYCGVSRSALSRELNRMKREGVIQILPKGRRRVMRWKAETSSGKNSRTSNPAKTDDAGHL